MWFRVIKINLIKKGKMHNQGFITFKKVENAEFIMKNMNGYYFHGKPIIIVI